MTDGHPDFFFKIFDTLTIDDSRLLNGMGLLRSLSSGPRVFLLALRSITAEAQHSLLKLLEDPAPGVLFFLIAPPGVFLLPTLFSRFSSHSFTPASVADTNASSFLSASLPERLSLIGDIIEEKDKKKALDFLNALEAVVEAAKETAPLETLQALVLARSYLSTRSPSVKMILESLALTLPAK